MVCNKKNVKKQNLSFAFDFVLVVQSIKIGNKFLNMELNVTTCIRWKLIRHAKDNFIKHQAIIGIISF